MNEQDLVNAVVGALEAHEQGGVPIDTESLDLYLIESGIDLPLEVIYLLVKIIQIWSHVKDSSLYRAETSFRYDYLENPIELVAQSITAILRGN